jgi:hypothetical protein
MNETLLYPQGSKESKGRTEDLNCPRCGQWNYASALECQWCHATLPAYWEQQRKVLRRPRRRRHLLFFVILGVAVVAALVVLALVAGVL